MIQVYSNMELLFFKQIGKQLQRPINQNDSRAFEGQKERKWNWKANEERVVGDEPVKGVDYPGSFRSE